MHRSGKIVDPSVPALAPLEIIGLSTLSESGWQALSWPRAAYEAETVDSAAVVVERGRCESRFPR